MSTHSTLSSSNLHPPKQHALDSATPHTLSDNTTLDVSTAKHGLCPKLPDDSTKFLNGVGAYAVPPGAGGGGGTDYIKVSDHKSSGTSGGNSVTTWTKRDINTEDSDSGGHCSISSSQITLAAGTYRCRIRVPGRDSGSQKARLQNITDSTTEVLGSNSRSEVGSYYAMADCWIIGRFTIAASKTFEIQHRVTNAQTVTGWGVSASFGVDEIYTEAEFFKES